MAPTPPLGDGPDLWTRRRLLTVGGSAVLVASGCSPSNPTIDEPDRPPVTPPPSSAAPSAPSATPTPAFPEAAADEQGLADLAAAVAKLKGTTRDDRSRLTFLKNAHIEHARALASPDPALRPTTAPTVKGSKTSLTGLSLNEALRRLGKAEASIAASHRRAALGATGATALLWGSMAVAAETFAAVADGPPPYAELRPHRPVELLSDLEASQEMVRQLHAIIWGYQLAIGKLPVLDKRRPRALARLLAHRVLRDRLIATLVKNEADVPAAEAAYVPSVNPTDAPSAGKLIRSMETALQPFCGLWLAAAGTDGDRELALTTLRATSRVARSWGAGVRGWPGWDD